MTNEGVRCFTRRIDPGQLEQLRVAGLAYERGSLSVADVATLLDVHPVDAVALLEEQGYSRSLEMIALDEKERRATYARIRADRLARGGEPAPTSESIGRDVVASERIEGVDARRWIHRVGL